MFEVYRHTSPSGKSYVGWTSQGWRARWCDHVRAARKGAGSSPAFHRAIRKYGADAFTHEVLERMTTEAGAKRAEQLWIRELGTFGRRGYNLSEGGDGNTGWQPTEVTRARIGAKSRGRVKSAESRALVSVSLRAAYERDPSIKLRMGLRRIGRKASPESIEKTAAAHRGRKRSAETREKISLAAKARTAESRKHSAETRAKIGAAHLGRKRSAETCAKISLAARRRVEGNRRG